ncbi:hypothetical protein FJZ31_21335 [Candidatus Poribacteria bacterium]|nr:hypothetical protein [Candidatus Poribacteria bacterium]
MWDTNKQERFSTLWEQKFSGTLTQSEQAELDSLINELDKLEQEMLQPALERLGQEHKQIESQNAILESLLKEREQLLRYAKEQIQQILQEAVCEVNR